MNPERRPLFNTTGLYPQHGPGSSPEKSNHVVAEGARKANAHDNLRSLVFAPEEMPGSEKAKMHTFLFSVPIIEVGSSNQPSKEYRVSLVAPRGPYTEVGTMISVADPNALPEAGVAAQTIYDFPRSVQRLYWGMIISTMLSYRDHFPNPDKALIVGTESDICQVTSEEKRVPRTLRIPHAQVNVFEYAHMQPLDNDETVPNLIEEQRYTSVITQQKYLDRFYHDILQSAENSMTTHSDVKLSAPELSARFNSVRQRLAQPYGYELGFNITADNALHPANLDSVQVIMEAHNTLYRKSADAILASRGHSRDDVAPQPSRHLLLSFIDNKLTIMSSPVIVANFAGAAESSGVRLNRSEANPRLRSEQETERIRRDVGEKVRSRMQLLL